MRSHLLLGAGILALAGCGEPSSVRWSSLDGTSGQPGKSGPISALLPDGQNIEFEELEGAVWGKVRVARDAWKPSDFPGVVFAPAPLLGLGRPLYRLEFDGRTCATIESNGESPAELVKRFQPGTFGYWRNSLFLGVVVGDPPPEHATLSVRLDTGAEAAHGHEVHGRRFSGKGLMVWPGERFERTLDLPAGSALSFGTCTEPASALEPPGGQHLFRILVDGKPVFEHAQHSDPGGSFAWHTVRLPERDRARLGFEVDGRFAYTWFVNPVIGPAEKGTYQERPWSSRPSIVLFLADTFRADNLALYGGAPDVTPELGRFAEESLRFRRAWSVGTFTLPGHASLFSGLYPRQTSSDAFNSALPAEIETIAEVLARAGYRTGAITDSAVVSLRFGLHQGFDWFDECDIDLDSTLARAKQFLDADDGRPVFLFVHTYRAHEPYREHELPGTAGLTNTGGLDEYRRLMGGLRALGKPEAALEHEPERARPFLAGLEQLYRSGAHDVDRGFGSFWRDLASRGFPAAGYVLFTSDHGEAFFEHGQLAHQGRVFEEQIRIPLLVRGPGVTPRTVDHAASLVDLAPTLAAMAGVAPLPYWQGANLLELERDRQVFAFECAKGEFSTVAVLDGPRKLIALEEVAANRIASPWQAFDLASDPHEVRDLKGSAESWPVELFRSAAPLVDALLVPLVAGEASQLDADRVEQLNDLGYAANQ